MADQKIVYPGAISKLAPNLIRESLILRSMLLHLALIMRANIGTIKCSKIKDRIRNAIKKGVF